MLWGFLECKVTTGVFVHPVRDIRVVTHVDDFLVAGERDDITWLRDEMSQKYELKVQIAGWEDGDLKGAVVPRKDNQTGPRRGDHGRRRQACPETSGGMGHANVQRSEHAIR